LLPSRLAPTFAVAGWRPLRPLAKQVIVAHSHLAAGSCSRLMCLTPTWPWKCGTLHRETTNNIHCLQFQTKPRRYKTLNAEWGDGELLTLDLPVLNSRTTSQQKCEAVPRRARSQGSQTVLSLNTRLESNEAEKRKICSTPRRHGSGSLRLRTSLGGVPREQKMLKGHLPRVIYHQVY